MKLKCDKIVSCGNYECAFNYGGVFIGMPEMEAARIDVYQTIQNIEE